MVANGLKLSVTQPPFYKNCWGFGMRPDNMASVQFNPCKTNIKYFGCNSLQQTSVSNLSDIKTNVIQLYLTECVIDPEQG